MGRIIEGQVVASTNVDARGERLSKGELEELFQTMPDPRPVQLDHDALGPPVALASNKRLVETGDGEWAIKTDLEVLDEEAFARVRGMSIAFDRRPSDVHPGEPRVEISYNPGLLDGERLAAALRSFPRIAEDAVLVERTERSLLLTAAVFAGAIWVIVSKGFWEEAGADLYRATKALIEEATSDAGDDIGRLGGAIEIKTGPEEPHLIVRVTGDGPPDAEIDPAALLAAALALAPGNTIVKVVAEVDATGKAVLNHAVDISGTTLRPTGGKD